MSSPVEQFNKAQSAYIQHVSSCTIAYVKCLDMINDSKTDSELETKNLTSFVENNYALCVVQATDNFVTNGVINSVFNSLNLDKKE